MKYRRPRLKIARPIINTCKDIFSRVTDLMTLHYSILSARPAVTIATLREGCDQFRCLVGEQRHDKCEQFA